MLVRGEIYISRWSRRTQPKITFCEPHVLCNQSSVTGAANPLGFSNMTCRQQRRETRIVCRPYENSSSGTGSSQACEQHHFGWVQVNNLSVAGRSRITPTRKTPTSEQVTMYVVRTTPFVRYSVQQYWGHAVHSVFKQYRPTPRTKKGKQFQLFK